MRMARLLLLPALIGASFFLHAQSDLESQRNLYSEARSQISNKNWSALAELQPDLQGYPLAPYIEYERLMNQPGALTSAAVAAFSDQYADTPLAFRVQRALLDEHAKTKQWRDYIASYQQWPAHTDRYQCLYWQAQLATGTKLPEVIPAAQKLWPAGYSLPNACDPVFNKLIKAGKVTSQMAYQRYWAAIAKHNSKLAAYAARFVTDKQHKEALDTFARLRKDPFEAPKLPLASIFNTQTDAVVYKLVRDTFRRNIDQGTELWFALRDKVSLSLQTRQKLISMLGTRLAKNFRPGTSETLARLDPDFSSTDVTGWRIRLALADQRWADAEQLISKLPEAVQNKDRWRYWRAISHSYIQPDDKAVFEQLKALAHSRSFYGFLAAELSDQAFDLNNQKPAFSQDALNTLAAQPAFKRMPELLYHGQTYYARSEWNKATAQLSPEEQHQAAHLARRWGWHDQSIRGAITAKKWNDMSIRFPIEYQDKFFTQAQRFSIPANWAMAVARQESAYRPTARSHAGARGLMQLMPQTARQTSRRHQIPLKSLHALYEPATNIQLGSAYLSEMLQDFNGNRIYATAAYNAGPHRVKRWLKARGDLPLDIWIETIPFDETRNYVQNVLAFAVIYDVLSQRPTRLLNEMESTQLALVADTSRSTL